jgi:hypothetical protein
MVVPVGAPLRPMPDRAHPPDYDGEFIVRRLNNAGVFSWKSQPVLVDKPLRNQPIGLKLVGEDEWELHFGPVLIGFVRLRDGAAYAVPLR